MNYDEKQRSNRIEDYPHDDARTEYVTVPIVYQPLTVSTNCINAASEGIDWKKIALTDDTIQRLKTLCDNLYRPNIIYSQFKYTILINNIEIAKYYLWSLSGEIPCGFNGHDFKTLVTRICSEQNIESFITNPFFTLNEKDVYDLRLFVVETGGNYDYDSYYKTITIKYK